MVSQADGEMYSLSIDYGQATDVQADIYRVGLQRDFSHWLKDKGLPLSGYFEGSFNVWKANSDANAVYALALSPVWGYSFCKQCQWSPYVEAQVSYQKDI